jgi:hypothetical protein
MRVKYITNFWGKFWEVNDRYQIYADGIIYDTKEAKDIPQKYFKLRDRLLAR